MTNKKNIWSKFIKDIINIKTKTLQISQVIVKKIDY